MIIYSDNYYNNFENYSNDKNETFNYFIMQYCYK